MGSFSLYYIYIISLLHMYIWSLPLTLKLQFQRKFSELLRAKSCLSCGAMVSCDGIFASSTLVGGLGASQPTPSTWTWLYEGRGDHSYSFRTFLHYTRCSIHALSLSTHITPELPTCPQWLWRPNMTWEGSSCWGESRPEQWLTATDNVRKQLRTQSVHPGWVTVTTLPPALQYNTRLISCYFPLHQ